MKKMMTGGGGALVAALAATLALGGEAAAQADRQAWFPFLGCWAPESGAGPTLCIRPSADGVELARVAEGQIASRESFTLADEGTTSSVEGCEGTHAASASRDMNRIFLQSEFECQGGRSRSESGLLALIEGEVLLDVRSVDVADEEVSWVQIYRVTSASVGQEAGVADLPLPGMALETARRAASASPSVDDVVEAYDAVGTGPVEAWLAETGDRFDLDASTLIALSDDGVPESLIDLMIVVSNPDQFALAVSDGEPGLAPRRTGFVGGAPFFGFGGNCLGAGFGAGPFFGSPFLGGPFAFGDPFFFGSPFGACGYRLSRYAFGPLGWGGGWYGWGGGGFIPVIGDGGVTRPRGSVVNGRGYTRGGSAATRGTSVPSSTRVGATRARPARTSVGASRPPSRAPASRPVRRAKPRGGGGSMF